MAMETHACADPISWDDSALGCEQLWTARGWDNFFNCRSRRRSRWQRYRFPARFAQTCAVVDTGAVKRWGLMFEGTEGGAANGRFGSGNRRATCFSVGESLCAASGRHRPLLGAERTGQPGDEATTGRFRSSRLGLRRSRGAGRGGRKQLILCGLAMVPPDAGVANDLGPARQ